MKLYVLLSKYEDQKRFKVTNEHGKQVQYISEAYHYTEVYKDQLYLTVSRALYPNTKYKWRRIQ